MRKRLRLLHYAWRAMGLQYCLLLCLIAITALCVQFTCVPPLTKLVQYARYMGAGLENAALFQANPHFHERWSDGWNFSRDFPDYLEARQIIDGFAQRALCHSGFADLGANERVRLYVCNETLLRNLDLPGDVSRALLEYRECADCASYIPLMLDERLRATYATGDVLELKIRGNERSFPAIVAGYLASDYELPYSGQSGSYMFIDHIFSRDTSGDCIALCVNCPELGLGADEYTYSKFLLFPPEGERVEDAIADWQACLLRHGIGDVITLRQMRAQELALNFTGPDAMFGLVALLSLALLLVGLRGFMANMAEKLENQASVYRLLGIAPGQWRAVMLCAYGIPVTLLLLAAQCAIFLLYADTTIPYTHIPITLVTLWMAAALVFPLLIKTLRPLRPKS